MLPYYSVMRSLAYLIVMGLGAAAVPVAAQLLPQLPAIPGRLGEALSPVGSLLDEVERMPGRAASRLAAVRAERIARLVRAHPDAIALDPDGFPSRAHEIVVADPDDALIARARSQGFRLIEREDALGIGFARLEAPADLSLSRAIRQLRRLGARDATADQLHSPSGAMAAAGLPVAQTPPQASVGPTLGMIDGGVAGNLAVQRGFAIGAPSPSDHGTAVASLIAGSGRVRGAVPGARLLAADVYGRDPAGGSATAIAKALAWLVGQGVPVVTISLVGPPNLLLGRVIAAAQARGAIVVAAVGNDGPAAPFAYPASYPGVVAVTGVDGRRRVLMEAGRARHLDYAAPGADMLAANATGAAVRVRGTSFAVPFVAGRIARAYPALDRARRGAALAVVDREAERLGTRYGRGLICFVCRTPPD